ncbi:MAG: N-acyl homoserine lactonase family protein [Peptococcaceae bacterium]|nr:N-acyl homoserine lactonase family protein [Peptococcaceae bacterium]
MKKWKVKLLYMGHSYGRKGQITPNLDPDLWIEIPFWSVLLQADGRNILVDSGCNERFVKGGKGFAGMDFYVGRKYLDAALKDANITPEEIDTVVYTHLHNDHAAFSYLFKNARIIAQKKEWATLLNPLPSMLERRDYDLEAIPELKTTNMILIDGDMDLTEGVRLIATPGHTAGSMSVAVNTSKGVVAFVADHFHFHCMAFPRMTEIIDFHGKVQKITPAPEVYADTFLPSSIIYNHYDWYDSSYKIKAIVEKYEPGYILAGHEPGLMYTFKGA